MSKKKKILLCEDDQGISEVIKIMLDSWGYEAFLLNNGKGIIKKTKQYEPNLILLDLSMPGIGGKEVTLLLKREESTKHIPIVIISALNDIEKISKTIGADDFLPKPFDMKQLSYTIEKYI